VVSHYARISLGARILVVHDDPHQAAELLRLLRQRGHEVEHAQLAASALRQFADRQHDIVLAEVMLPDSTGTVFAGNLRKLPAGADVPVVLISQVYGSGDLLDDELDRLGILHFLPQPFSLTDLMRRIGRIAAGPALARELVREKRARSARRGGGAVAADLATNDFPSLDLPLDIDEPSIEGEGAPDAPAWMRDDPPEYGATAEVEVSFGRVAGEPDPQEVEHASPESHEATTEVDLDIGRPSSASVVKPAYFRNLPLQRHDAGAWVRTISDLFHHRDAGELKLTGDDTSRTFYVLNGYPVWVEVEPPEAGCAAYLQQEGWITESEAGRMASTQTRLGWGVTRTLSTLQILRPEEVDALLQGWVAREVAEGLNRGGHFEFRGGDEFTDRIPVYEVNPISALWGVVQTTLRLGTAEIGLSKVEDHYVRRKRTHDRLFGYIATTSALNELKDWLGESRAFESLRDYFEDDWEEVARCLWFGVQSGVIEVTEEPADDVTSLAEIATLDIALEGEEDLSEVTQRFGKEEVARILAQVEQRDAAEASAAAEEDDPELRIIRDYIEKMEQDHYHFLAVERDCSTEELQAAYDRLAERYRPTSLPDSVAPDVRRKGKELLARLVRAWRVLSEPARRRAYDAGLGEDEMDRETGSWDTAVVDVVDDDDEYDDDEST